MRISQLSIMYMIGLAVFSSAAAAQDSNTENGPSFYVGGSATALVVSDGWTGQDLTGNALGLDATTLGVGGISAGVSFNRYIAIEGEYQVGLTTEQHDDFNSIDDAEVKLDKAVGAYLVGSLPVSSRFSLFIRGGVYRAEIDRDIRDIGESDIEGNASSIGGGLAFHIKSVDVRLSFTHHEFDELGGANSAGVVALKRF